MGSPSVLFICLILAAIALQDQGVRGDGQGRHLTPEQEKEEEEREKARPENQPAYIACQKVCMENFCKNNIEEVRKAVKMSSEDKGFLKGNKHFEKNWCNHYCHKVLDHPDQFACTQ